MEEKKQISSLEELEQQFQRSRDEEEKKNKLKFLKTKPVLIVLSLIVVAVIASRFLSLGNEKKEEIKDVPQFLTEEEKEDWDNKEVDVDEVFIKVNTNLEVKEGSVDLRLSNPPYSAYPFQIKITDEAGEEVYYQSEVLDPGEYLETVKLENLPEKAGTYNVGIHYSFYAEKGSADLIGEHIVNAEIIIP